jgi:hypothetical protein
MSPINLLSWVMSFFCGPYKSSLEVDDAPGLIAIFKADSLQLLNLYQTVSVRASADA